MTLEASDYILSRPHFLRRFELPDAAIYHERYVGFSAEAHAHEGFQLLMPLAGRMHLSAGRHDHLLGPEWAALIFPHVPHGFSHIDGTLEFLSVAVPAAWVEEWGAIAALPAGQPEVLTVRESRLWSVGQQLAQELEQPAAGAERVVAAALDQLGAYFFRAASKAPEQATVEEPRVLRAVARILNDYGEELSVEALAAELAMSPRHFERCFKQTLGQTPKRFLIDVRIGAAREMLERSSLSVTEIALRVGFKNPSHFSDTFQRLVGQAPSAFRHARTG